MTTFFTTAQRDRALRGLPSPTPKPHPIPSCVRGNNADLIKNVCALHAKEDGLVLADVTFGRGNFWPRIDVSRYTFLPSDILPKQDNVLGVKVTRMDLRRLAYKARSIDRLVLDPPYRSETDSDFFINATYENHTTTKGMNRDEILDQLYYKGLLEANRVLRPFGQAWVKGADETHGWTLRFFDEELKAIAALTGFEVIDKFPLMQYGVMPCNSTVQKASRKNYSYLLVLRKVMEMRR